MRSRSIDSLIANWEKLLGTARASATEVPGLDVHIATLEEVLAEVKAINILQDTRKGIKQQATQERKKLLQKGKDLANNARSALRSYYGFRNERLTEFGAVPFRAGKRAETEENPPPQPEAAKSEEPEPAKQPAPAPTTTPTATE